MCISNDSVWMCKLVLLLTFGLAHTYYDATEWRKFPYFSKTSVIRTAAGSLPFITTCGFSMTECQPNSVLMCSLTWMQHSRFDGLGMVDISLGHPDLIYCATITFYGNIWRILFMRLHLTQMRISLVAYPKLLHVWVKYLASLNVYANWSTYAVKHISLLVNAI